MTRPTSHLSPKRRKTTPQYVENDSLIRFSDSPTLPLVHSEIGMLVSRPVLYKFHYLIS